MDNNTECVTETSISPEENLSVLAGNIVTNAMHIPRSLFCPFCADEYMFEFTLKDHLKRKHSTEILQQFPKNDVLETSKINHHICPYCDAVFYEYSVVPQHISKSHGTDMLKKWQIEVMDTKKLTKSIHYVDCSPGLSEIFNNLDTQDNDVTPKLKSILKKTSTMSGKIIFSPSSASIRRTKVEIVKRSSSVRRELRFDLPQNGSQNSENSIENIVKGIKIKTKKPKNKKFLNWKSIFRRNKSKKAKAVLQSPRSSYSPKKILTSTPINCLDDDFDTNGIRERKYQRRFSCDSEDESYFALDEISVPSFYALERFQCALCDKKWDNNADLVIHLKDNHNTARNFLQPHYKCGQCGAKFYRNSFLVRHCHCHHTPLKIR